MSGVEFDGQGGWSGDSDDGLSGGGAAAVWVGHAARDGGQGWGEFGAGEVCSQAVVNAAAEREHGRRPLAGDVEAVGVVIDGGVAVGGGGVDNHLLPAGILTPASSTSSTALRMVVK